MNKIGLAAAVAFVGTVWAANWALARWGVIDLGPWRAPAGVLFVGVAFTLRDVTHRLLGRAAVIVCIVSGCLLAYFIEANVTIPGGHIAIATASAAAFLFSETADMACFTPLEKRSFVGAVAASNTVGVLVDSALFLWLAFGSLALMPGQVYGKLLMTVLALPVVYGSRRYLRVQSA